MKIKGLWPKEPLPGKKHTHCVSKPFTQRLLAQCFIQENYNILVSHKYKFMWKTCGSFLFSQSEGKYKKANPRDQRHNSNGAM